MKVWDLLPRFAMLQSLLLWQGGFLFYSLIVVSVGSDVLGSDLDQGMITQRVTVWMNRCGWLALALCGWEAWCTRDSSLVRKRSRVSLLVLAAVLLALLDYPLHTGMDRLLDLEENRIVDRSQFYLLHQLYLLVCSIHWFMMLGYVWLTLQAWNGATVQPTSPSPGQRIST